MLKDIGVIVQTRSKSYKLSSRGGDYIKFYFVAQNLIAILAILNAGMLGLDKEAAKRTKKGLTKEFNADPNNQFEYAAYASGLVYLQAPAFDTLRNIAHNYI